MNDWGDFEWEAPPRRRRPPPESAEPAPPRRSVPPPSAPPPAPGPARARARVRPRPRARSSSSRRRPRARRPHRPPPETEPPGHRRSGRLARSTAFFSIATGFSRVAGLVREIVAASYFGTSGAMSAFTIAFLIPNTVRSLFADAAIQAAFVPVFTEELERGRQREAFHLASTLLYVVALVLGADDGAVHPPRAADHADLRPRVRGRAARPDGLALAAAVPDPRPARGLRASSSASSTATTGSASSRSRRSSGTSRSSPCSPASRRCSPRTTRSTRTRSGSSSAP